MANPRVHEIAAALGVESRVILDLLRSQGEFVKGPSSSIAPPVARKVRALFGQLQIEKGLSKTPPAHESNPSFDSRTPSSRQFGWRAGAIPAPRTPDVLAGIERVARRFPVFREHLAAFQALGSQVVHARLCTQKGFEMCAIAIVRFSGAIESGFGITRELLVFYSPHQDLQSRTFDAALREMGDATRSLTPDTFFMWSPDQRLRTKLNDWSRAARLAIPLQIDEEDELSLISLLREYIYARDLFYLTTPVSGGSFFGRRTLLQSLREDVFNQRVTGLFGLRKSGKTSILMQLKEELADDKVVTVLMDLEAFPSPPEDPTEDLVADLRRRLIAELKTHKLRVQELSELSIRPTLMEFRSALQTILKHLEKDGHRVLLMLDEIEYLTPSDRIDIAEGDMPRVAQVLSVLRSIVQETSNFTFVLSGLTSAIVESGRLYGRPNPLFSWARTVYVKPLAREEADDLASTVGGKMGIRIDPGALEALHEASGGHAFLYRSLASSVVAQLPTDDLDRQMSRAAVLSQLADWKGRVQGNIDEMVQHVKRYYATEAVMLELLMHAPDDFAFLAPTEPTAVRRLADLGLIHEADGRYEVSVLLELA